MNTFALHATAVGWNVKVNAANLNASQTKQQDRKNLMAYLHSVSWETDFALLPPRLRRAANSPKPLSTLTSGSAALTASLSLYIR